MGPAPMRDILIDQPIESRHRVYFMTPNDHTGRHQSGTDGALLDLSEERLNPPVDVETLGVPSVGLSPPVPR